MNEMTICKFPYHFRLGDLNIEDLIDTSYEGFVFEHTFLDHNSVEKLVKLLELVPIKSIEFRMCEFDNVRTVDMSKSLSLRKMAFVKCDRYVGFVISCLANPRLAEITVTVSGSSYNLRTTKSSLPNNLASMADNIENNYSLFKFQFDEIESYLADTKNVKNLSQVRRMVLASQERIKTYVDRNIRGRERCRKTIYTLFLIKRFSDNTVFRLTDVNVLLIIARRLYATIGSKEWCS